MTNRTNFICRIFTACLFLGSCTSSRMVETNLYFGMSKPDGSMITESEWIRFQDEHFPDVYKEGSTVINVTGAWLDDKSHKLVYEPSHVVVYFYKRSAYKSRQIDSLRLLYKKQFNQQSVLRVDRKVRADF